MNPYYSKKEKDNEHYNPGSMLHFAFLKDAFPLTNKKRCFAACVEYSPQRALARWWDTTAHNDSEWWDATSKGRAKTKGFGNSWMTITKRQKKKKLKGKERDNIDLDRVCARLGISAGICVLVVFLSFFLKYI